MPSSTSSSEFENQYQTLDNSQELKTRLKTLVGGLFGFAVVVGLYLLLASAVDLNGRVLGMMDYMPQLAAEHPEKQKVMVFGTSMVQAGFEPAQFDSYLNGRGVDVVSYNYGVGNLNPEFQQYVTRHIRRELERANGTLDLTLLEFNPFQTTKARDVLGVITRDQNEAVLLPLDELWDITRDDPDRGVRLFNIRFLRDGFSAELITSSIFLTGPPSSPTPEQLDANRVRTQMRNAFRETTPEGFAIAAAGWREELRGGRLDKSQLSAESLDALQAYADSFLDPALMAPDLQRRIRQGDILGLDFEERLVQAFINMVNDLNAVSENMEVILLPRNTEWVQYTPEAQARLDATMARVTRETGVTVRDMQDHPDITPAMFVDTTHLSFAAGIDAYTRLLAETYEDLLRP